MLTLMNAFSCIRSSPHLRSLCLDLNLFLRPPPSPHTSLRCLMILWTTLMAHRCQFMGEAVLLLLICLLFAPNHLLPLHSTHLLHPFTPLLHTHLLLHCLLLLLPLSLLHLLPLLPHVLSAPGDPEKSGCMSSGLYPFATGSQESLQLLFPPLMRKMTLMIPLTFLELPQPPLLSPHHTDSPSLALMPHNGTLLARKRWKLTRSMALGKLSSFLQESMQLALGGL